MAPGATVSTDPRLVWPRTDGDPARWPSSEPTANGGFFAGIDLTHVKYDTYEEKAGEHLAKLLGIPPRPGDKPHRIPMPEGFKIFVHKQPRPNGQYREDYYAFGSTHVRRIRSAEEWKDHAEWLFDTTKSFERHDQECGCQSKKGSRLSLAAGAASASTPPPKRSAAADKSSSSPRNPKKPRLSPESVESPPEPTGCVPERSNDLGSGRRFRRGELVWMRITTIPADPADQPCPDITHWPALIADLRFRTATIPSAPATLAAASSGSGSTHTVHQYWEYHLRPLGMFSRGHDVVKDVKDLLPWAVGPEVLGGTDGWRALAAAGTKILGEGVRLEAAAELEKRARDVGKYAEGEVPPVKSVKERWDRRWGNRYPFEQMAGRWSEAAFRIGVAIKTGLQIARSWCQTDRVDVITESFLTAEDKQKVGEGKKNFYQGLWLGGERIWAEDTVRIKKTRLELPGVLGAPSTGAENRAVFLRIRTITLDTHIDDGSQDEAWRCLVYGDIAELAPAQHMGPTWATGNATSLVADYKAPKGFMFKQLNEFGSEVTLDIADIAGRVYYDLVDPSSQNWFSMLKAPEQQGRQVPGDAARALMGLLPGSLVSSAPTKWIEDLYGIVDEACRESENAVKEYYASQLKALLGPIPAVPVKVPKVKSESKPSVAGGGKKTDGANGAVSASTTNGKAGDTSASAGGTKPVQPGTVASKPSSATAGGGGASVLPTSSGVPRSSGPAPTETAPATSAAFKPLVFSALS